MQGLTYRLTHLYYNWPVSMMCQRIKKKKDHCIYAVHWGNLVGLGENSYDHNFAWKKETSSIH